MMAMTQNYFVLSDTLPYVCTYAFSTHTYTYICVLCLLLCCTYYRYRSTHIYIQVQKILMPLSLNNNNNNTTFEICLIFPLALKSLFDNANMYVMNVYALVILIKLEICIYFIYLFILLRNIEIHMKDTFACDEKKKTI